jgi:hypothetical protein
VSALPQERSGGLPRAVVDEAVLGESLREFTDAARHARAEATDAALVEERFRALHRVEPGSDAEYELEIALLDDSETNVAYGLALTRLDGALQMRELARQAIRTGRAQRFGRFVLFGLRPHAWVCRARARARGPRSRSARSRRCRSPGRPADDDPEPPPPGGLGEPGEP